MLIDAHTHIDHYEGAALEAALAEINKHQILTLSNAMHAESYQRTLNIAERCSLIVPSVGIHPWCAAEYVEQLTDYTPLIEQSPLIGEIGLDYLWVDKSTIPAQHRVFEFFLAAARKQDKIVNLHTKAAEAEVFALLQQHQIRRAIIHWYSGPIKVLRQLIAAGYYFTIGVEVLHSKTIQKIARRVPLNQLLTETDNPGALTWLIDEPGQPRHLLQVIQALARLKEISPAELIETVAENLRRLSANETWFVNLSD